MNAVANSRKFRRAACVIAALVVSPVSVWAQTAPTQLLNGIISQSNSLSAISVASAGRSFAGVGQDSANALNQIGSLGSLVTIAGTPALVQSLGATGPTSVLQSSSNLIESLSLSGLAGSSTVTLAGPQRASNLINFSAVTLDSPSLLLTQQANLSGGISSIASENRILAASNLGSSIVNGSGQAQISDVAINSLLIAPSGHANIQASQSLAGALTIRSSNSIQVSTNSGTASIQ